MPARRIVEPYAGALINKGSGVELMALP